MITVITQEVLEEVVPKIFGSSTRRGTTKVCVKDATIPANARTATNGPVLAVEGAGALRGIMGTFLGGDGLKFELREPLA